MILIIMKELIELISVDLTRVDFDFSDSQSITLEKLTFQPQSVDSCAPQSIYETKRSQVAPFLSGAFAPLSWKTGSPR